MTHRRNVEGLRKSAQAKSARVLQRTNEAIGLLLQQKRPVNFKTVAEAAGVSTPYLYQNQAIRERIMHLRGKVVPPAEIKPKRERVSDASRDAVIETLRHRLKELEGDNRELRKQIEVAYGLVQQAQVSRSKQQERDCLSFVDTSVT
jgi:Family of unknown function (DUF6262)